ncbi:MAG: ABC transporter ATP-binding protein [Actinomycetota bacterium]|nr:ABC transporter ATP-binding protein [Actinomycetota bacterium]
MLKLFKQLKPYSFAIVATIILIFLQSISELFLPGLMSDIINNGILKNDINYILKVGGYMLLITAGSVIVTVAASFLIARIAMSFGKDVREKIFTRVESYSLNEVDKIGSASLITRTTNDVVQIQNVFIMMRMLVMAIMMGIGGIVMAVTRDAKLSIIFAIILPILVSIMILIGKKGLPLFRLMQLKVDRLNLVMRENLIGIRVIRAFNRVQEEKKRFDNANKDFMQNAIRVNKIMAFIFPSMMFIMSTATLIIVWFSSIRINNMAMNVGDMVAFIQYSSMIMFSFLMGTMMFILIPRAQASADRINEVLNIVPEINDPENPADLINSRGHVEFKDVTFAYKGAEQPVVNNVSFTAEPGKTTAIVGSTGCGKSTIINLLCRFYDIQKGEILIDGIDIRQVRQSDLRNQIGLISQKSLLFSGTIAENIKFGYEEASDSEIRYVSEIAQVKEFVDELEKGFDTLITQGGTNLSGGQKQRISIARALIRKPKIFIFDDSFSALDFKTDAKLRNALKKEVTDSTIIIVSQRVSTVMNADKIIVLEEGKIVGSGKHRQLLDTCSIYREIVASQLSKEELD